MSCPIAKAQRSKFKDARQSPAPEKRMKGKRSKKNKPFIVEYRWNYGSISRRKAWMKWGAYKTLEIAEKVISDAKRKYPDTFEIRLKDLKPDAK